MTTTPDPTSLLLPGWDIIRRDFVEPGLPGRVVIRDNPKVELFVEAAGARFGALFGLPTGSVVPPSPFTDIEISEVRLSGKRCVEISTRTAGLFDTFYLFAVDMARAVVERSTPPINALGVSLAHWRALLQISALLSDEKQIGLAGELWLLERLIGAMGPTAIDAWVGPDSQSHDFRLGPFEFEVKATTGARRVHTINGLHQMTPTVGAELYLLSIRFSDGGSGGDTLGEVVARIVASLPDGERQRLNDKLALTGFRSTDTAHYSRRRRLADRPRLILVDNGVPRLTADALLTLPPEFAAAGISNVSYRIDVEGMGFEEGRPEFTAAIPDQ